LPSSQGLSARFIKPEVSLKAGNLSFNIVRVVNLSDTAIRIKPILLMPDGWKLLSLPFRDTVVNPRDSISLAFRYQLPSQVTSEIVHQVRFRAYSSRNQLLAECISLVNSEVYHDWDVLVPENRVFFYPRMNYARFDIRVVNRGNIAENIQMIYEIDQKIELNGRDLRSQQETVVLRPYTDTTVTLYVKYKGLEDRVFDMTKIMIYGRTELHKVTRTIMIEKYSDLYAPLFIDNDLPHQAEVGLRTFSGNREFLPFIKARGIAAFKNAGSFSYNFNYYSVTGNENLISNSYYTLLYHWQSFKAGIGAFSSPLGRNLYTRSGVMLNNSIMLAPWFGMEAFVCQSFFIPKTSAALGYDFKLKKTSLHGSAAYDVDNDKKMNTASMMLQSELIPILKKHSISFNLYGYHEKHYRSKDYTLMGVAWDLNYYGYFGERIAVLATNNYGSPDIPGPQMGLMSYSVNASILLGDKKKFVNFKYVNASRKYSNYNYEGTRLPMNKLFDQYVILYFHSSSNTNHMFDIGPSIEFYHSTVPGTTSDETTVYYEAQKLRLEYKGVIFKNLTLNVKGGLSDTKVKQTVEKTDLRYDFHVLGAYSFKSGYGVSFNYDYGPMVNTGLYQFAMDVQNHSINLGPSVTTDYFHGRLKLNLFANLTYRIDMDYTALNVNPKLEFYLARNWYVVLGGTYHYTQQRYSEFLAQNSHTYAEFSIKKNWGKSNFNEYYKNARSLKIVMFQDDNANGVKDYGEQGVPFVKTRVKLTNTSNPDYINNIPVDITLLSNDAGVVIYNRLPMGFYDISITPLVDVKEYFYVNRSAEKIELNKTTTYYIPFQKASKITGKIDLKRQKISRESKEIDLLNIKITAYNKQGNSYSSFTLKDGSFTIYVPGNITYFVRMENVFGSQFKIPQNDIQLLVQDKTANEVVFNVIESSRQIAFKQTKAEPETDTVQQEPLKIKVLHGKFYENRSDTAVDKNAIPDFNIQYAPAEEQIMIRGKHYIVAGDPSNREDAVKYHRVFIENGINTYIGLDESTGKYYVFTNYYDNPVEARRELDRLIKNNVKAFSVMKY